MIYDFRDGTGSFGLLSLVEKMPKDRQMEYKNIGFELHTFRLISSIDDLPRSHLVKYGHALHVKGKGLCSDRHVNVLWGIAEIPAKLF